MSKVIDVDVLKDWNLSADNFYSIVAGQTGSLSSKGRFQLQAAAIPVDVDGEKYRWFSKGNLSRMCDSALEPVGVSDSKIGGIEFGAKLSSEYKAFVEAAMSLVEMRELSEKEQERIDRLQTEVDNLSDRIDVLQTRVLERWRKYCESLMKDAGDVGAFAHWYQGQPIATELKSLHERARLRMASVQAIRARDYENPDHREIADTYKELISPASTMRYPMFADNEYPEEERKKFSPSYFAGLSSNESNLFRDLYLFAPEVTLEFICESGFGSFSSKVTKESVSSEKIESDWGVSGSASYGVFKVKSSLSGDEKISEDFSSLKTITVSAKSLMAVPIGAGKWFNKGLFKNNLIRENAGFFDRWLGEKGSLRIVPTHIVLCRGFSVVFESSQKWTYDYERDFKAGGSGKATFFGINFGGGGDYHKHIERQKVESNGHLLTFSDGDSNVRFLGFHTVENDAVEDVYDFRLSQFRLLDSAADKGDERMMSDIHREES